MAASTMGSAEDRGRAAPRIERIKLIGIGMLLASAVIFMGVWRSYPLGMDEARAHASTVWEAVVSFLPSDGGRKSG